MIDMIIKFDAIVQFIMENSERVSLDKFEDIHTNGTPYKYEYNDIVVKIGFMYLDDSPQTIIHQTGLIRILYFEGEKIATFDENMYTTNFSCINDKLCIVHEKLGKPQLRIE